MQRVEVSGALNAVTCPGQLSGTRRVDPELLSRLELGEQLIGDAIQDRPDLT